MTTTIALFLGFGAFFGLVTFSRRHFFSEGPHQPSTDARRSQWGARLFWVALCSFLWPIMVISGLNTVWVLAKRRARARKVGARGALDKTRAPPRGK